VVVQQQPSCLMEEDEDEDDLDRDLDLAFSTLNRDSLLF